MHGIRIACLIILPLAAAATTLWLLPHEYVTTVTVRVDSPQSDDAAPSLDNLATRDRDLRSQLLGFAWVFENREASAASNLSCRVANNENEHAWLVQLTAATPAKCRKASGDFETGLRAHFKNAFAATRARRDEEENQLAQRVEEIQGVLHTLAEQAGIEDSPSADTPISRLTELHDQLDGMWSQYADLLGTVNRTRTERDALQSAPKIEQAVVDPAARDQNYRTDTPLQEDMRHLEIQLFQIRRSMLAITESSRSSLEEVLASAKDVAELSQSAATALSDSAQRSLLEQTGEKASDFAHHATRFAQAWTRDNLALADLRPDPEQAELLTMLAKSTERLRAFRDLSRDTVATLRRRMRALTEQSDGSAGASVAFSKLLRRVQDLQSSSESFHRAARELFAADNCVLNAALESARGLWRRTNLRRASIDKKLETLAIERAREQRLERIDLLTEQLREARQALLTHTSAIMDQHDRLSQINATLPSFVELALSGRSARDRSALLKNQLNALEDELQRLRAERHTTLDPQSVRVEAGAIPRIPANGWELIGGAALAGCLLLLILQTFWRSPKRSAAYVTT